VFGAEANASASQSVDPPKPPVNVTVTVEPGAALVALTLKVALDVETAKGIDADNPPPGAGENTVICAVPAAATSAA